MFERKRLSYLLLPHSRLTWPCYRNCLEFPCTKPLDRGDRGKWFAFSFLLFTLQMCCVDKSVRGHTCQNLQLREGLNSFAGRRIELLCALPVVPSSFSHTFLCFTLALVFWDRYWWYPHFKDEETEAGRDQILKITNKGQKQSRS